MTWIILLWIFQGYSLFSYQCSLLFSATLIYYHIQKCLSTTFLFFLFQLFRADVLSFLTALIFYQIVCHLSTTFSKKIRTTYIANKSGERGIWTLAPVTRPIPLAGAPLRPLEYFSKVHYLLIWCCSLRLWRINDITKSLSVCQDLFSTFLRHFWVVSIFYGLTYYILTILLPDISCPILF